MPTSDVILIVEDRQDWQETLNRMLSRADYRCEIVSGLDVGLQTLHRLHPVALVLDLQLGQELPPREEFRGWKLAEAALRLRIPTVIVTAYASIAEANKAFRRYKAIAFLDKGDLKQEDLLGAVSEALEESRRRRLSEEDVQTLVNALRRTFAPSYSSGPVSLEEEKKVRRKLVLHYVRPSKSLSVTIEDERGHRLFGDDSPRQMDIDVHSFGLRADDAWRSPQWRDLIKGIGQDLYAKLFTDHSIVVEAYHRAMGMVDNQDEALSLVFSSTRDTLRLPVEFLHDGHEYLCLRHPVSRYLQGLHSRPPLSYKATSGQRLRFLLVASDTGGISNVDREVATLRKDLYNLLSAKGIDRNIVALSTSAASHKRVVQELENKGHDVWHYAGHGLYDKDSPERSALVFWEKTNRKGDRCFLLASDLCDLTRNTSFSLVYLSCCLGTTAGDIEHLYQDDFLGLADALAEAKVPTVIGFRWPVSDDGAVAIARTFYKALCKEDFNPRRALWQARRTVTHGPQKRDDPTWASPVLIEQS